MREKREAKMLIYPPARSQALARILMAVYLLNVAVRSELARGKVLHLLGVVVRNELLRGTRGAPPWYGFKGIGGSTSLARSQVTRTNGVFFFSYFSYFSCFLSICNPLDYDRDRRRYMNVLIRSMVERGPECHGKEVSITESLKATQQVTSTMSYMW